jgi:uncharacterized protein (TIGR03437 family)
MKVITCSLTILLIGLFCLALAPPARAQLELISVNAAGTATGNSTSLTGLVLRQQTSANARFVVFFSSATDLVPGFVDGNSAFEQDVFLRDRMTGTTTLISINAAGTASGNDPSGSPIISPDGRFVAFQSRATDLVGGIADTNADNDVFVRDTCFGDPGPCTPTTFLVSINTAGTGTGNGLSERPLFSPNGTRVAFRSQASNLVATPTGGVGDLFLRDLMAGTTTLITINSAGTAGGNGFSQPAVAFSADGNRILFQSTASDLTALSDTNGLDDVFVRDLATNTTFLISVTTAGTASPTPFGSFASGISADGNRVVFWSFVSSMELAGVPEGNGAGVGDVFVRDLDAGTTTAVSINAAGTATGNNLSDGPTMSADGRFVAFASRALNLEGLPKSIVARDIFVRDLTNNTTALVSVNSAGTAGANMESTAATISLDGSRILFQSLATNLVDAAISDTNGTTDAFVRDLITNTNTLVSINTTGTGTGNGSSFPSGFSDDGSLVVMRSIATDLTSLPDNNAPSGGQDLFAFVLGPPPPTPAINVGGVVNGASFAPGAAVAAGSIMSVFGTGLATSTAFAGAVPLPTVLGGAALFFNDAQAVPQFFASVNQINAQLPWELAGQMQATLTDTVGILTSAGELVQLATFAPGLFSTNQAGTGQGAILISGSGGLVAAPVGMFPGSRPANRGEFIEIFCTGLGPVTNQPPTGSAAGSSPLSVTTTTPVVTIGGVPAVISFSGLAPGFVGLYQVNVQVPAGAPVGNAVAVALSIGGVPANVVTIAVQ